MADIHGIEHPTLRTESPCTCIVVDEKYWFSHYGATEPGSMMEFEPTCPEHGDPDAEPISDEIHNPAQDQPALTAALQNFIEIDDLLNDWAIPKMELPSTPIPAFRGP